MTPTPDNTAEPKEIWESLLGAISHILITDFVHTGKLTIDEIMKSVELFYKINKVCFHVYQEDLGEYRSVGERAMEAKIISLEDRIKYLKGDKGQSEFHRFKSGIKAMEEEIAKLKEERDGLRLYNFKNQVSEGELKAKEERPKKELGVCEHCGATDNQDCQQISKCEWADEAAELMNESSEVSTHKD